MVHGGNKERRWAVWYMSVIINRARVENMLKSCESY